MKVSDKELIDCLVKNHKANQYYIAKEFDMSQPSVNQRIKKLEKKKSINSGYSANINVIFKHIAILTFHCEDKKILIDTLRNNFFLYNTLFFKQSPNTMAIIASNDIQEIVETCKSVEIILRTNISINFVKECEKNMMYIGGK